MRKHCRQLDISVGMSGPHGFAVRDISASSRTPPRPPHPAPNVRDDAYAPLIGQDGAGHRTDFSSRGSDKFFESSLDTRLTEEPVEQISRPRKPLDGAI